MTTLGPKPTHEPLADLYGIGVGGGHRRFVVDARRDQVGRPALERRYNQAIEFVFVRGPRAACNAGTARDGDEIGGRCARRRLRTGDLINAVVPYDDRKILRRALGDSGKASKLHEQRTVAFESEDVAAGLRKCDSERNWDSKPHAAEHVEVLRTLPTRP